MAVIPVTPDVTKGTIPVSILPSGISYTARIKLARNAALTDNPAFSAPSAAITSTGATQSVVCSGINVSAGGAFYAGVELTIAGIVTPVYPQTDSLYSQGIYIGPIVWS